MTAELRDGVTKRAACRRGRDQGHRVVLSIPLRAASRRNVSPAHGAVTVAVDQPAAVALQDPSRVPGGSPRGDDLPASRRAQGTCLPAEETALDTTVFQGSSAGAETRADPELKLDEGTDTRPRSRWQSCFDETLTVPLRSESARPFRGRDDGWTRRLHCVYPPGDGVLRYAPHPISPRWHLRRNRGETDTPSFRARTNTVSP